MIHINSNEKKDSSFSLLKIEDMKKEEFFEVKQHILYELVCISKGDLELTIDFQVYKLKENTIYIIKPGQVHQWSKESFSKNSKGVIFHFSKDFLPSYNMINQIYEESSFPIIELPIDIFENINLLTSMIKEEKQNNTLKAYLFGSILEYVLKFKKNSTNLYYKDERIYLLLDLIEKNFIDEKFVSFYSKKLDLTSKRLNELTKKYLNQTVSSLIIDRNIVEIKRELTFSNLSITEISENLGFNNPSYFSKFFKQYTSISPLEFREQKINYKK